jgi:hypothetical protein
VRQRWALRQHSCKNLGILSFHVTARQLECADAAPGCHQWELPHHDLKLFSCYAIAGFAPEGPAQADKGRQAHLAHYLFDSLRGPSQHDRPASRLSPAQVLSGDGFQSCSKGGVSGEQRWLRLRSLPRGARPLFLCSRLLAFLGFPTSPSLLGSRHFFEAHCLSVRVARRIHIVFGRCRVPTCYNTPLVGLIASILSRLLAAGLAARQDQVCLGRLPTPAGMGLSEIPWSRTR